jgi:phosphoglucosamine mutase
MKKKLFGTDGLRGQVNIYPMTPEVTLRLGLAAGRHFRNGTKRHRVVIGKDTRLSGYIFEYARVPVFALRGWTFFWSAPCPPRPSPF